MNHSVILRRSVFSLVRNVFFTSCWVIVLPLARYSLFPKTFLNTAPAMPIGSMP